MQVALQWRVEERYIIASNAFCEYKLHSLVPLFGVHFIQCQFVKNGLLQLFT